MRARISSAALVSARGRRGTGTTCSTASGRAGRDRGRRTRRWLAIQATSSVPSPPCVPVSGRKHSVALRFDRLGGNSGCPGRRPSQQGAVTRLDSPAAVRCRGRTVGRRRGPAYP